jgi:glutamate 5-kinase
MKIVVKVGTQSILSEQGNPFESVIASIVDQIGHLQKNKHQVVLVSSGAVGFGRNVARQVLGREYGSSIAEKQVLASLGQHELMHIYSQMFKKHNIAVSQVLLTKQDFQTRKHYLNISRVISEILEKDCIIPIINENDSVCVEELMFTDNDELAGLIASQINADKLIILSNIEGVYTSNPNEPGAELIELMDPDNRWINVSSEKSSLGRGGMISKLSTARKMSKLGIMTHIASINQPNIITRLALDEQVGTKIVASKKQSNIKRWVAYCERQKNGIVIINSCLNDILKENKRVISLLPVGIESYSGNFSKGDIVEISNQKKEILGIGIARYDSKKLEECLGKNGKPAFIHYDYLHIF